MKTEIETFLWCVRPGKDRHSVRLAIGLPEPDPHGDYRCSVSITGFDAPIHVYGINALQAMSLAVNCVAAVLRSFQQKGYSFFLSETDDTAIDLPSILTGGYGAIEEKIANNQLDLGG